MILGEKKERELFVWEKNHIEECRKLNLFFGKNVLEVGGCIPEKITEELGVKSWTSLDNWKSEQENTQKESYKIYNADIATFDAPDEAYDFIFSTNAFEHIENLPKGLLNMKRMLKRGGYLSALFGPIWSCCKGHHIWALTDEKIYTFNDDVIPYWTHLLYSEAQMKNLLLERGFPKEVVDTVSNDYRYSRINHLFYEDYKNLIDNLGLKIIEFRDWHKPIKPNSSTLKLLTEKYGNRNFSTISIKILLQKTDS